MENNKPIGVFDSGYGGLTILSELQKKLPEYDFLYLGDNARAPYGSRSFDVVYEFTLEAVKYLFSQGCELVILACNTASAKALRTIQRKDMPVLFPDKKVLGVIRPSSESVGEYTTSNHIGILATEGTVNSQSYLIEINKLFPDIEITQLACPIWVPLIENNIHQTEAGKALMREDLNQLLAKDPKIDTIVLGCTHYPIVKDFIEEVVPSHVKVLSQGPIVAEKLLDYLYRHDEIASKCSKRGHIRFVTTEKSEVFDSNAKRILGYDIVSEHVKIA